jgi:hypothetical protein
MQRKSLRSPASLQLAHLSKLVSGIDHKGNAGILMPDEEEHGLRRWNRSDEEHLRSVFLHIKSGMRTVELPLHLNR